METTDSQAVRSVVSQLSADDFSFANWKSLPQLTHVETECQTNLRADVSLLERATAVAMLVVLSPLMLLVALLVKIDSPGGPVLYCQDRVGIDRRRRRAEDDAPRRHATERRRTPGAGQVFKICKFRTMIPDAEKMSGPVWASECDPRITRLGRALRYLRLDELPQLVNVIRGEMRLIGPRPERPFFVERLAERIPEYTERLTVHPGITGLAQVEKEYDADVDHVRTKIKYDLYYARHRSLILDIKILIKTLDVVVRGKGAR